ncbi:hypothetical protein B0A49_02831 [Cryomyces minteri]|uniref:Alpha-factor-transporting ATPase n=1 Tax=Cryomyces minteri TaxID=331657 RepID=A0A4U0XMN8_9PEZI|nr:hypothetical protein B0A49_02831 [Cryomyces minteri]
MATDHDDLPKSWRRSQRPASGNLDCGEDSVEHRGNPADTGEEGGTKSAEWKALLNFTTKKHIIPLSLAIVFSVLASLLTPAQAFFLGKIFDGFTSFGGGNLDKIGLMNQITKYCLYMVGLGFSSWLLHALFFTFWLAFGELQAKSARDRLFNGLLEKDIEWYDMRKSGIGALIPRFQMQIRELQLATSQPLGSVFADISTAVASLALAFYYSWSLTLVILATVPVVVVIVGLLSASVQLNIERQQEKLTEASKYSTNAFLAIETVKCFNGQDLEIFKFSKAIDAAKTFYIRQANANALQMGFVQLATLGMFVQGFWYGSTLLDSGTKNAGQVLTTFWSALSATQAIQQILPNMLVLEKGRAAGATLRAIMVQMEKGPNVSHTRGGMKPPRCAGDIDVRNLSFAYPTRPDKMALTNVDLFIAAGEITFLVGKSGSGKSTISQLLMRFYPPALGEIFLDGNSLLSLDVTWLRQNITLVEQSSVLFQETVFRNIAFGRQDHHRVSKEEVRQAAEFALLQQMINDMPDELETVVGSKGSSMSGGQRQRMALARARLRDTPILILDESTSALDHISRSLVMDAIREWRRGKTTIIITHDISQIMQNDYMYVLANGRVVQEGFRRQMEADKSSHFETFLPEDQRLDQEPDEGLKHKSSHSSTSRSLSVDSVVPSLPHTILSQDSLEIHLDGKATVRRSFVPTIYGNPASARVPYRLAGQMSPMVTSYRTNISPTYNSPASRLSSHDDAQTSTSSKCTSQMSNRWSLAGTELMEKFIEKTGNLAMKSRANPLNVRRRRPKSAALGHILELARPSAKMRRTEQRPQPKNQAPLEGPQNETLKSILSTIWPSLTWGSRTLLVVGFAGAFVHAVATPLFSWVFSKLLATFFVAEGRKHLATVYSLCVLGIAIGDATGSYLMHILLEYVGSCWVDGIRKEAMKRILDQPRHFFDQEENSVSRLNESLDRHAEEMRNLLGRFAAFIFIAVIMMTIAITWAMISQWKLTLVGLSIAPYVCSVTKAFGAVSGKWEARSNDASAAASAIFTETFTSIKTVRSLTLEKYFHDKYFQATQTALKTGFQRAAYSGFFFGLSDSSMSFASALIFYYGAVLAGSGTPTASILQVFTMLLFSIANVSAILSFIPQMASSRDTASRILRLAQLPQDSHEHMGNTRIPHVGNIIFSDLTFSYPARPDQVILKKVKLTIPAGISTALVGSSGSGKSTIASLLVNLYSTGPIRLDFIPELTLAGRDIKRIHTPTLRNLITIVSQTPTLFSATIAENIAYGLRDSSVRNNLASVRAAAVCAGIDEFITSLPLGYNTPIGEGGTGISGGQAQRISIARALVRKPSVLILDEATSALDVESAATIRDTIQQLVNSGTGMTVLIITHSRDMMRIAQNIVMLDQGQVVEEGGFDELMARRGEFARLLSGGEWTGDQQARPQKGAGSPGLKVVDWGARKR